jgi:3',5'-cyclic AMP phosphodiesterase CpdA
MRIAHISDLHIQSLDGVPLRRFLNKRATGLANLLTFRRGAYSIDVFERLIADLLDEEPEHVVVTGDLSNLALEGEFQAVFDRLKLLGGYRRVSTIPGNHDTYTRGSVVMRRFESTFYPFMFRQFSDIDVELYPYVKLIDEVAIIGVCSAVPTLPLFAWGRVGEAQLRRLEEILSREAVKSAFSVVLVHHNLHAREFVDEATASLRDASAFMDVLKEGGANLVLHGHDHNAHVGSLRAGRVGDVGENRIPVIGAGSSTRLDPNPSKVARYNVYTIEGGVLKNVETKVYDLRKRKFIWKF